jgi:cytochrome c553
MKATLQAYLTAGDTARLATALDELGSHAPDGFASWSTTAQAGAVAARAGDVAQVRAQCQSCHEQHRTAFRQQMRTTRLF